MASKGQSLEYYYLNAKNEQEGPVSEDTLRSMYSSKKVDNKTAVWNENMDDWTNIDEIPDLMAQLRVSPGGAAKSKVAPKALVA